MTFKYLVLLGIMFLCGSAQAQLHITVTGGKAAPQPIAVVPFKEAPGVDVDVSQIVQSDLSRSGLFKTLPRSNMLAKPNVPAEVNYKNWRVLGMNDLVIGKEDLIGARVSVQFYLLDVFSGEQLLAFRMPPTAPKELRYVGHRIADLIYKKLTGVDGYFDTQIAYVVASGLGEARTFKLVVADSDGKFPHTVASSAYPLESPAWSPDRKELAFTGFEDGRWAIYIETLATGRLRKVISLPGLDTGAAWSPNGRQLAVTLSPDGIPNIYIINLQTGDRRQLTHGSSIDTGADWSPNGKSIVFTSDRDGSPQIFEVSADGSSAPERLTFQGQKNMNPELSPDGKNLALVQEDKGKYCIGLMNLQTGDIKLLTSGPVDTGPSFAPNGAVLIYERDRSDASGTNLGIVSTDGVVHETIKGPPGKDLQDPAWSPYLN